MDAPLTIEVAPAKPYLHLDNRALVLHDGRDCVLFANAAFAFLGETLRVLIDEGRATRQQGAQVFGGFVEDGTATIFAGTASGFATCELPVTQLSALHARLGRR